MEGNACDQRGEARRDAPGAIATGATSAEAIETDGGTTTVTTGCDRFGTRVGRNVVN